MKLMKTLTLAAALSLATASSLSAEDCDAIGATPELSDDCPLVSGGLALAGGLVAAVTAAVLFSSVVEGAGTTTSTP
ncbi:MAG: hypothetical protein GY949_12510 [Gammaproteobacteria bacterium]|nr:hypothetical protein [Gammaproteobacteria bacterium]